MTTSDSNPKKQKPQSEKMMPDYTNFFDWFFRRFAILCFAALFLSHVAYFRMFDGFLPGSDFISGVAIGLIFPVALLYRGDFAAVMEFAHFSQRYSVEMFQELQLRRRIQNNPMRYGHVYVIQDVDVTGWYKIGKSDLPAERIGHFDTMLPFQTRLIHIIPSKDASKLEIVLHRRFADKRKRGEWFDLSQQDVTWLMQMAEG